jgi:MFS family permease
MTVVELVPTMLLAPTVARWCTRASRARALALGYLAQLVTLAALGFALADAPALVAYAAAAVTCVANSATRPVHYAILPDIAETTEELTASNAMSSGAESVAAFLGPLAAGLLMVPWGPGGVVLASAALVGVSVVLVARPALGTRATGTAPAIAAAPGWRSVLADPTSRKFGVLTLAAYALLGALDILLVVLAIDVLGMSASGPGLLNSAAGAGALVGTAATLLLVGLPRLRAAIVTGAVVAGVPIAFAGIGHSVAIAVVLVAFSGGGRVFHAVASFTLLQRALPQRMLVTVFGLLESTMSAGMALGALVTPVLISLVGITSTFVIVGLLLPVVAILTLPGLRRADEQSTVAPEDVARLTGVPFLRLLTPLVVERLAREQTRVDEPADTLLVREGERGDAFYVVASGRLEVTKGGAPVRDLGPGDWFGELALLRDAPRSASVRAMTDVGLAVLDREAFLGAVTGVPRSVEAARREAVERYDDMPGDGGMPVVSDPDR